MLGKVVLGNPGPVSLGIAFHAVRLGLAGLFLLQAWRFYGEVLTGRVARRIAFMLAVFTSGLGVLVLVVGALGLPLLRETPFDLYFLESSAFFGLLASPHFAAVLVLMVVYARALHRVTTSPGNGWAATAVGGASALALASVHTEKLGVVGVASLLQVAWLLASQRNRVTAPVRRVLQAGLTLAPALPYALYAYGLSVSNVTIADVLRQGTPVPVADPLPYYLFGFGLPGICMLWGVPRAIRRPASLAPGEALLWSLAVGGIVILLVPWDTIQHRGEGLQLALAGLGGRELTRSILPGLWRGRVFAWAVRARLFGYGRRRLRVLTVNIVLILSCWSILALAIGGARAGLANTDQLYLGRDDQAMLSWLRTHAAPEEVVLGEANTMAFVAAYGGTHVVWGDFAYTPRYESEGQALAAAFAGPELRAYLAERHIDWVYFGPREALHAGFDPGRLDYLKVAHREGRTTVYRVLTR